MAIPKSWEQSFHIHTFQMDPRGLAHLTAICNYLQEAASMHALKAGLGFDDMLRRNQVWVLTRLKVQIEKYPSWNDQLLLHTWSRGNDGIFYLRDFNVRDHSGSEIIKATSSWAALNLKTRRPGLVDGLEDKLYSQKEEVALVDKLEKLPELTRPVLLRNYTIQYTDIDIVYHVNNVKYIEIMMNAFPLELHKTKKVQTLEVNYLGEANYGDEVNIFSQKNEMESEEYLLSVVRKQDEKEVCRAKFIWI
jgi:medium-chain acyl-[acyl-carrier-protein] hydrolase